VNPFSSSFRRRFKAGAQIVGADVLDGGGGSCPVVGGPAAASRDAGMTYVRYRSKKEALRVINANRASHGWTALTASEERAVLADLRERGAMPYPMWRRVLRQAGMRA
jgi:hypothetical protein